MSTRKNIFILYMPPTNPEAMRHFEDTVASGVALSEVTPFLPVEMTGKLEHLFGRGPVTIWGSRDSHANRSKFNVMRPGDDILVVVGGQIRFLGFIADKFVSPELSRKLWANILPNSSAGWDLIYFIANPVRISVPWIRFCELMGYSENYQLRGFTRVADDTLDCFYASYDSIYEVLLRMDAGQPVRRYPERPEVERQPDLYDLPEDIEREVPPSPTKHVEMQWKLSKLGIKAGSRIWVPVGDQGRIRQAYHFDQFEEQFSSGLDVPIPYVENIDVVWKDQYRIDAAFEVEHSTSIYSGLLRFSDLKIVAPNSMYPLFVVADSDRRQRLRDQLMRPTFRQSEIRRAVRFLPYESVEELWRECGENGSTLKLERVREFSEDLTA